MPFMAYILGALASVLMGLSKTGLPGAAILGVAVMAEAFPTAVKLSVGAMLPILLVGDCFAVAYYRRHTQWDRIWGLFPFVFAGIITATFVLRNIGSAQLGPLLGAIILALIILEVVRKKMGWEKIPHQWWFIALMGFLAGFGTTMGNVAGPIMSIYLLAKGLVKEEFIGTAAWFFFIVNLSKIPFFVHLGMITPMTLKYDLFVFPFIIVGALLGVFVLTKLSQQLFSNLVMGLATLAALHLLLS